ncbi:MAG: hypothetical protein CME70_08840 [Halobacteriovorax sp.]|nr:hypothetical protein [Halobacteriovorax sp.]|tara:strand:+ start:79036 stop:80433 length:1398 start_codon:yes stop_codon:yes gene_type:complete
MRICIDIDNTLLNYEPLFFEESKPIPKGIKFLPELKEYLQKKSHDQWLKVQGLCYGKRVTDVNLFQRVKESIQALIGEGHEVYLVSHKTKTSYCGNYTGLQNLVLDRLEVLGLTSIIKDRNIFLLESLEEKLEQIIKINPDIVIDDLEKVLNNPKLEEIPFKILFSRTSSKNSTSSFSWSQIVALIRLTKKMSLTFQDSLSTGNNSVGKFKSGENTFVIKCFSKDERYLREKTNLSLIDQEVKIIFHDDENLILVTNFIDGISPSKFSQEVFSKLEYLFQLNSPLEATHKRITIEEYLKHIENRLIAQKPHYSSFIKLHENLLIRSKNANYSPSYNVFCAPDLSLDNLIEYKDRIEIIDLESSGMDDPLRSLGNAIFHSRNQLSQNEILELFSFFEQQFPGIFSNSFELVLDLVAFDWLLLEKDPLKSQGRAETYQNRLSNGSICFSLPESIIDHGKRVSKSKEL